MSQKIIFTLGFEKLTLVDFVRMVKDQEIRRVVDIRAKNMVETGRARFAPEQLSAILKNINVEYFHLPEAGIPLEMQNLPKINGHSNDFSKEYKEIILSKKEILSKIKELLTESGTLILGFEEDIKTSHRLPFSEIVMSILGKNYEIQHLTSKDLKPLDIPPPDTY